MSELEKIAHEVGKQLSSRRLLLTTAESCTGGWLAQVMTANPGSSMWFDCGFVTYTNNAKQNILHVSQNSLQNFGAVSLEVANEMAKGALNLSQAQLALAITGIAGPTGGSLTKPVGTVCFAGVSKSGLSEVSLQCFPGNRSQIRFAAVEFALHMIKNLLNKM